MSDAELTFRSESDYISKYRRVLDHFDAVRIGLTATPALHTTAIFGAPVFQYTYRQAVIDGWVDISAVPQDGQGNGDRRTAPGWLSLGRFTMSGRCRPTRLLSLPPGAS